MAHRLTLAVLEESGAELLYGRLAEELRKAALGNCCRLIRRDRFFIDIEDDTVDQPGMMLGLVHITAYVLADYIVEELEDQLLTKLIAKHPNQYTNDDTEEILAYCRELLSGLSEISEDASIPLPSRKTDIARRAETYLSQHVYLDLEGFLRFRLTSYRADLKDTVDYAVDEFISNRQYQEFISLLKYFVYFQDAKIPEVHLIHYGGNKYAMLDHRLKPIELSRTEEVVVETIDRELNYEDMIVSTLISASPKHVSIHTRDPNTLSIKTIRQIFEGRTTLCTDCKFCKSMLDERQAEGVNIT